MRTLVGNLRRSNADLENFAYIASHDLQEPLRMVTSYLQLLERRCGDRLDTDGRDFLHFAVDGARRMKTLIFDLLTFSRAGRSDQAFVATDFNEVLRQVRSISARRSPRAAPASSLPSCRPWRRSRRRWCSCSRTC